ncbi:hypothetical protein RB653_001259 [Dictyostelium firmibasis]|uniref:ERCC4 domain-containing protein n=1 Tax=Dictyostelium firmibasis TaxID=79012 RepID=A0AAN7TWL8_9MYCE
MSQRDIIAIESSEEEEDIYKTNKKPFTRTTAQNLNFNLDSSEGEDDLKFQTFLIEEEKKKKALEEKKKSNKTNNSSGGKRFESLTINKKQRVDSNINIGNDSHVVDLDDEDDYNNNNDNNNLNLNFNDTYDNTTTQHPTIKKSSSKRKSKSSDESDNNNSNTSKSSNKKKRSTKENYQFDESNINNTNSMIDFNDDDDEISDSELDQEFKLDIKSKKSSTSSSTSTSGGKSKPSSSSSSKQKSTSKSIVKKRTPKPKKITKETCLAETFIIFDKNLESEIGIDDIKTQLESKTTNIEFVHSSIPFSIRFLRRYSNNDQHDSNGDQDINFNEDNKTIETYENFVILKYSAKMLTQLIQNNDLIEKINKVKRDNPTCNITLLIESLDSHLLQISKSISKQTIQRGLSDKNLNAITMNLPPTKVTIEKILVQIQMDFSITIRTIENRNDVVNFLSKSFQTIALLPLRSDDQLFEGFCADSIKKRRQTSLSDTWSNQLCQITGVSSNIARGIVSKYPTIATLLSFYGDSSSEQEKENLLKDVKIDQNRGTKNLGPVLSSKIYHIFSSKDPNRIIY